MTTTSEESAKLVTQVHVERVGQLLDEAGAMLHVRGIVHDRSKWDPIEMGPLQEMQELVEKEGHAQFGTPEYERRKAILAPMLEHHYANNSHHPEHYENGVSGMNLFDLMEMFFDWKAASERANAQHMGLEFGLKKYAFEPQLESIFRNTAKYMGYTVG